MQQNATVDSTPRSFFSLGLRVSPILRSLTLLACLPVWLGLAARWWWVLELATHFTAYLAAVSLVGLLGWMIAQRWKMACYCGASLVVATLPLIGLYTPVDRSSAGPERLKVLAINVLTGNRQHDQVLQVVDAIDPDIVLLLEVNQRWVDAMAPIASKLPTHRVLTREDNFGVALYSRLPADSLEIRVVGDGFPGREGTPVAFATLDWNGDRLTFIGAHPLPPGSIDKAQERNDQLAQLARFSAKQPGLVVLAGDLNVTPFSPTFIDLLSDGRLVDSAAGYGLQATWHNGRGIGLAIDHVLHSPELVTVNRSVGPQVGSDHLPILVELAKSRTD